MKEPRHGWHDFDTINAAFPFPACVKAGSPWRNFHAVSSPTPNLPTGDQNDRFQHIQIKAWENDGGADTLDTRFGAGRDRLVPTQLNHGWPV